MTFAMYTSSRVEPDRLDDLRQQLTGAADERLALDVFVRARRLADEHQVRRADCRRRTPPAAARACAACSACSRRCTRGARPAPRRPASAGGAGSASADGDRRALGAARAAAHRASARRGRGDTPRTPSSRRSVRCSARSSRVAHRAADAAARAVEQALDAIERCRRPTSALLRSGSASTPSSADDRHALVVHVEARHPAAVTSLATIRSTCFAASFAARAGTGSPVCAAKPTSTGRAPFAAPTRRAPPGCPAFAASVERERAALFDLSAAAPLGRRVVGDRGRHHDDIGAGRARPSPPRASRARFARARSPRPAGGSNAVGPATSVTSAPRALRLGRDAQTPSGRSIDCR